MNKATATMILIADGVTVLAKADDAHLAEWRARKGKAFVNAIGECLPMRDDSNTLRVQLLEQIEQWRSYPGFMASNVATIVQALETMLQESE